MTRHIAILRQANVVIDSAWVLLDCDRFGYDEFRDQDCSRRIEESVGEVRSIWKLSELEPFLRSEAEERDQIKQIESALVNQGARFWRVPYPL